MADAQSRLPSSLMTQPVDVSSHLISDVERSVEPIVLTMRADATRRVGRVREGATSREHVTVRREGARGKAGGASGTELLMPESSGVNSLPHHPAFSQ